jgi:hypothetical protein
LLVLAFSRAAPTLWLKMSDAAKVWSVSLDWRSVAGMLSLMSAFFSFALRSFILRAGL